MRYIDRAGEVLNSISWGKLYRNPSYSIVYASRRGQYEIVTSWIGVHSEYEKTPRPFLVQLRSGKMVKVGNEKHEEFSTLSEEWYETEEKAMAAHHLLEGQRAPTPV